MFDLLLRRMRAGFLAWVFLVWAGCSADNPQLLFEEALQEENQGKLASAQKLYQQILAKDPNHIDALEHYGFLLLRINERAEAARQLQRIVILIPDRPQSAFALARLYLEEHQTQKAEELLGPWRDWKTVPVEARFIQADLAYQKNNKSLARQILEAIAKNNKGSEARWWPPPGEASRAKIKLSALALQDRRFGDAEKMLKEVLVSDPKNLEALIGMGNTFLGREKQKEAAEYYAKAWIDPAKPPLAAVGLVLCAIKEGDPAKAAKTASELSARYPTELNYSILLAELAVASNQPDVLASLELSDKAGIIKQYVEGLGHFANQQYFDAYPLLTAVAKEWANYGPAQLFAGRSALNINDHVQALEFLKDAEKNLPPSPEVSTIVARAALVQSQPDLALVQLSKLPELDSQLLSLRAEVAFRQGQYEKALSEAEKWKKVSPDSLWAQITVADIKYALNKPAEARQLWKQAAASGQGPAQAWAVFRLALADQNWTDAGAALDRLADAADRSSLALLRGRMELDRGLTDQARSSFDAALREDQRNASAYSWIGVWKVLRRQIASAHEDFGKALELNPADPMAHWGEGFIALLDRRYPAAKESFEKSLRANPAFDLARLMLAQTLLAQAKNEDVLKVVEQLGPMLKETAPALDIRGRAQILTKRWDEALETWKSFRTKYPKSPIPFFYTAQIQFLLGKKDEARQTVEEGLKVAPNDMRLQLAQADLLWSDNKKDEALLLTTQLAKDGKNIEAALLVGAWHLRQGHYSKASSAFKALLVARPDDARLYSLLYEAQMGLGKAEEAALTLRTGWLRLPDCVILGLQLAALQEKNKNWQEAISTYREVLKIQPANTLALNQLAWLLTEQKTDLDEALKLADQANKLDSGNVAAADTRAWILYLKENFSEARQVLEELVKLAPENAYVWYHWGLTLWKSGDSPGAKMALQKALALQPNFSEADKIKEVLNKL